MQISQIIVSYKLSPDFRKVIMGRFNSKLVINTENIAGGKAYSKNPKEELAFAVITSFLEDKFYESGDDRIERIKQLVPKVGADFAIKLTIATRLYFNMRSTSHVLVGEIAKNYKGVAKDLIKRVSVRPDDLIEICAYLGKPLPNQIKKGVALALNNFSEYQLAKYKNDKSEWSLVDLFNLTHPKGNQFAEKLVKGELVSKDTWESEVSKNPTAETWEKLILSKKMGYMAMLRNLNNFIKYNISDEAKAEVIRKLTDVEEIKRSKQLPFRFYTAYKNVTGDIQLSDAVSLAMDKALDNMDTLSGRTLIGIDTSGSMYGKPIEIASIFAAALIKKSNCEVVLYDTDIKKLSVSTRTPIVDLADRIQKEAMCGGTQTSLVFKHAEKRGKFDRIFILSDNESWAENSYKSSVQNAYTDYKKLTEADPYVYAIDIEGYGTHELQNNKVYNLSGWSDKLLDFVKYNEKGIVQWIENLEI